MTIAAIQAQGASAARLYRTRVEMGCSPMGSAPFSHIERPAQMHNLFDLNWPEGGLNHEDSEPGWGTQSPPAGRYSAVVQSLRARLTLSGGDEYPLNGEDNAAASCY